MAASIRAPRWHRAPALGRCRHAPCGERYPLPRVQQTDEGADHLTACAGRGDPRAAMQAVRLVDDQDRRRARVGRHRSPRPARCLAGPAPLGFRYALGSGRSFRRRCPAEPWVFRDGARSSHGRDIAAALQHRHREGNRRNKGPCRSVSNPVMSGRPNHAVDPERCRNAHA